MAEVEHQLNTRNGLYGFEMREQDLRRKDGEQRKTYEIKQMWQRTHEIVNLAARGFKQVDIAKILNIDPQTVSNTLNSQLGEEKLAELRHSRDEEAKVVCEEIRVLTDKALSVYHEIFDDESGNLSLMNKKEVADTVLLELSGLRVPTKVQSNSVHAYLNSEELAEFKRRGIEAARESGMIVEVDVEVTGKADKVGQDGAYSRDIDSDGTGDQDRNQDLQKDNVNE